jgi:hypothetical protein
VPGVMLGISFQHQVHLCRTQLEPHGSTRDSRRRLHLPESQKPVELNASIDRGRIYFVGHMLDHPVFTGRSRARKADLYVRDSRKLRKNPPIARAKPCNHWREWRWQRAWRQSSRPWALLASSIPTTLKEGASDEVRVRGPGR